MTLEDFIIHVCIVVDDFFQTLGRIRQRGPSPRLADAEVVTIEIVGEFLGFGSDKRIFDYFSIHWKEWFPALTCRTTFIRHCANLWKIKEKLQQFLVQKIMPFCDLFLFDGFPLPTCHVKRVRSHNPLKGHAAFGYCASKDKKYFGFKGHLLTTRHGLIVNFSLTPANVDERDVLPQLTASCQGMAIADKGLIRPALKEELGQRGLDLQTPLRSNMKDLRSKVFVKKLMSLRRNVETVISQLTERFKIQSIKAKDTWHLAAKVGRKILAHTFCFFTAQSIQFDSIISL